MMQSVNAAFDSSRFAATTPSRMPMGVDHPHLIMNRFLQPGTRPQLQNRRSFQRNRGLLPSPNSSQSFIDEDYAETYEVQDYLMQGCTAMSGGKRHVFVINFRMATIVLLCCILAFAIFRSPQGFHSSSISAYIAPNICASEMSALSTRISALEESFYKLTRDNIAKQDFASRYNGAEVDLDLTTHTPGSSGEQGAMRALDDNTGVGRCWHIPQSHGQLGIKLPGQVFISEVTIDHAARELVSSVTPAPRRMIVWGICPQFQDTGSFFFKSHSTTGTCQLDLSTLELLTIGNRTNPLIHNRQKYVPIATFEYNIHAVSHIQTFPVFQSVAVANMTFGKVVLEILDNWGDSGSTCLYRMRIHGQLS